MAKARPPLLGQRNRPHATRHRPLPDGAAPCGHCVLRLRPPLLPLPSVLTRYRPITRFVGLDGCVVSERSQQDDKTQHRQRRDPHQGQHAPHLWRSSTFAPLETRLPPEPSSIGRRAQRERRLALTTLSLSREPAAAGRVPNGHLVARARARHRDDGGRVPAGGNPGVSAFSSQPGLRASDRGARGGPGWTDEIGCESCRWKSS